MVLMKVHSSRMMTVVAKIIGALPKKKKKRPQIDILATGHMHRLVMLIIILPKYFGKHNRWSLFCIVFQKSVVQCLTDKLIFSVSVISQLTYIGV